MGNILFRRKKIVTEELDEIQQRSQSLEEQITQAINNKRSMQWLCSLTLFAIVGVSLAVILFYVPDRKRRILYSICSFITGLLLIYTTNILTNGYYEWSIGRKRKSYDEMTKRKVAILEQIKETETFKVAKEILEKYGDPSSIVSPSDPVHVAAMEVPATTLNTSNSLPHKGENTRLSEADINSPQTPLPQQSLTDPMTSTSHLSEQFSGNFHCPRRPPRPFLGPQRSWIEKVVDFLLGDGPNYRYALICNNCYSHNGMARENEFDYICYNCWVCGTFNRARKQRQFTMTNGGGGGGSGGNAIYAIKSSISSLPRARSESTALNQILPSSGIEKKNRRRHSDSVQRSSDVEDKNVEQQEMISSE